MELRPLQHFVYCFVILILVAATFLMANQYSKLADDLRILKQEYNKLVLVNREK